MALILYYSLLILFPTILAASINEGFTMELIHRYSERSPYYNPNLTESQIMQRLIRQPPRPYIQQLDSTSLAANTTSLLPPISKSEWVYLVKLDISTSHHTSYYLYFDTGSSLTWIQCKPCSPCFQQPSPIFDPINSPTYQLISRNHRLCTPPFWPDQNGNCHYNVGYGDGSSTKGLLSTDTFAFMSDQGNQKELVPNLVFGCSHSNEMHHHTDDLDGTFGIGPEEVSILKQMRDHTDGRFSYCLAKQLRGASGFLQFRNGALKGPVQRTPFEPPLSHYFLTLNDITIANQRLNLPPGTFARHSYNNGGCLIDTGTTLTQLIKPAYDRVSNELIRYFKYYHFERTQGFEGMEICYSTRPDFKSVLPQMILHFRNADYRIGPENLFFTTQYSFCFAVLPSNVDTIIGWYQQHNVRFEYNLVTNMLSFVPEDCALDTAR